MKNKLTMVAIEIIKFCIPLLVVLLGWMLTNRQYRSKLVDDRERKLKKILYCLLEIRHQLKIITDFDRHMDFYISQAKNYFRDIDASSTQVKNFFGILKRDFLKKYHICPKRIKNIANE